MKKLLLLLLFVNTIVFGQKQLYKTITYNDLINFYNDRLKVKGEDLTENIKRCEYIIEKSKKENDENTVSVFSMLLKGLIKAQTNNRNNAYITIYKDDSSYNFYDDGSEFVGRIYKEKFDEDLQIKGNNTETIIENFYYLLQD